MSRAIPWIGFAIAVAGLVSSIVTTDETPWLGWICAVSGWACLVACENARRKP